MAPPRLPRITFRTASEGGEVRLRPQIYPAGALTGRRRLVLLIHGFNNSEKEAREAYDGFCRLQRELGDLNPDQPVGDGNLVEVYWPGDVGWFPAKNYEDSLERAIKVGRLFAEAFARLLEDGVPKAIDVVAHSMGCRLTLEVMRQLLLVGVPDIRFRRMVFFAAAVPTFLLEGQERLRKGLDNSQAEGVLSLFSPDDWILDNAFPLGQWDAQGEGWTNGEDEWRNNTVALGVQRWVYHNAPAVLEQAQNYEAGHSDYWGRKKETRDRQGRLAGKEAMRFLQFTAAGSREQEDRLTVTRSVAPQRTAGLPRDSFSRSADGSEGVPGAEM